MRIKRALAAILCSAMLLSSESFSMGVLAGTSENVEVQMQDDVAAVGETKDESEEQGQGQEQEQESEEVPELSASPSATPQETDEPEATEEPTQIPTQTPAEIPEETGNPSETPSTVPTISPDATESPDATPTMDPEGSMSPSAVPTATSLVETENSDIGLVQSSEDFLEVDGEGVLRIKDGKELYGSTIKIPKAAKKIPVGIFNEKTSVKYVIFEEGSQLEKIEAGAFEGCGITSIEVPEGVTSIEDAVFKNSYLSKITFKGQVTSIGKEAFSDTPIEAISGSEITSVGNSAFSNCSSLTEVRMPKLETIGTRAFQYCTKLNTGMVWSSKLVSVGKEAFKGCGFVNLDMAFITNEGIVIEARAFESCTRLSSVTLPGSLQSVETALFKGCTALTSVTLPETLVTIGEDSFANCTSLQRMVIPQSVQKIQARAFENCESLTEVSILNPKPEGDSFVIAQNAFPNKADNSKVTMNGYDGKVQEYAESRGYQYQSLFQKYKLFYFPNDYASFSFNKGEAVPGDEIVVTVTVKAGYSLTGKGISVTSKVAMVEPELVSTSGNKSVFRFVMPGGAATVSASVAATKDVTAGTISYEFKSVNGYIGSYDEAKKQLTLEKTGQETALIVKLKEESIGSWLLNYKSSNTNVATISDKGVICAKGQGTATITAALRNDSKKSVSIKVNVTEDAVVNQLKLNLGKPARATLKSEEVEDEDGNKIIYPVIEYNKATLASEARSFNVSFEAFEQDSAVNLLVNSTWKSIDNSIAGVKTEKSADNTNTITVKKGVEGETLISVSVQNKDLNKTVCTQSFIIRVVDATPRLADSKIAVNSQSTEGTEFDLVPVYGYKISEDSNLKVCRRVVSSGIVQYEPVDELTVLNTNGDYYIKATSDLTLAANKSITYKGNNMLYLQGEFDATGDTFIVPIPELTITNKALNPSIQIKGKINLFYNSKAAASEQGSVVAAQNIKNEEVSKYELVSEANYQKEGSEAEDSFAANFTVVKQTDGSALITRSKRESLVQKNGKNVVVGYLYIYYKGYNEPVKKKITVPTCNVKPNYELSVGTETASVYRENQEYTVYLRDKKTKNKVELTENTILGFDYDATTEELLFDRERLDDDLDNGNILIKIDGKPRAGKAVITVQMDTWDSALKYTFHLKTSTKHPVVKVASNKLTLNTLCKDQEAVLSVSVSGEDAEFNGFDKDTLIYTGSKTYKADADKLIQAMQSDSDGLKVFLPTESIKAMTYNFKVMPKIRYKGSNIDYYGNQIAFSVTVKNNDPEIKPAKNVFSLNVVCPGVEKVSAAYSVLNVPEGMAYQINADELKLIPVRTNNSGALETRSFINLTVENDKITAQLDAQTPAKAFSYEYYVDGLKIQIDGNDIALKKFKIKVSGVNKSPAISVSGKGTINPVNPNSQIVYTAKISNINSAIKDVRIWELKSNGDYYYDGNGEKPENRTSEHFDVRLEGNNAIVTAKQGVTLTASTQYRIKIAYILEAVPDKYQVTTKAFTIKPVQTLPKIKTDRTAAYLYAGQNRSKTVNIGITQMSVPEAEITGVVFAKNTPDNVKKAYRVSYDASKGMVTLRLVNPASVVLNKKYTITLETKCKNQLENSTGTTFRVDVTVRK